MKPGKTVQRSSKSALITEGLISSRVDKSRLSLLMFFLAQGTLTNHWPPSNPLWEEVRITARWFKGIALYPDCLILLRSPTPAPTAKSVLLRYTWAEVESDCVSRATANLFQPKLWNIRSWLGVELGPSSPCYALTPRTRPFLLVLASVVNMMPMPKKLSC